MPQYFDIDWNPPKEALRGKVLLPVLGDQFGKMLEDQQLQLAYEDQRFVICYYERRFPTDPRTWVPVLRQRAGVRGRTSWRPKCPSGWSWRASSRRSSTCRRARETERRGHPGAAPREGGRRGGGCRPLVETSAEVARGARAQTIDDYNGRRGDLASFDKLEALLAEQPYRLCYWRVATDEINYRRFFDVDELAAIRVEDPEVFDAVHAMMLRLVERGWVTGLRIDHADGLLDPQQYLANLAEATAGHWATRRRRAATAAVHGRRKDPGARRGAARRTG